MLWTIRAALPMLACSALVLACVASAPADDAKDKPGASGIWAKKEGQLTIEFADKDVMKIAPHGGADAVIVCSYSMSKEGLVKAKVTELAGKEEFKEKAKSHAPVGLELSFTWKVKGETATLEDVQGKDVDVFKSHMEGDFAKKKSD
ncbi:MAG TPA: hypothetical protein VKD71_05220 [Gemmataceae bacterium]|nr:hypothetical protein [Gemmataceae bacterium]